MQIVNLHLVLHLDPVGLPSQVHETFAVLRQMPEDPPGNICF
jgi:hypothetical protein